MKNKSKIVITIILSIALIIGGALFFLDLSTKSAVKAVKLNDVSLKGYSDGEYIGSYKISPVNVKVQVTVLNGKMTDIKILEHTYGLGKKAEKIVDDILEKQSLQVDTISGATTSSRTIQKAIENALQAK